MLASQLKTVYIWWINWDYEYGERQHWVVMEIIPPKEVLMPFKAMAVDPPVNPGNGSGAKEFNWQDEWGTIHMNSLADGLNDPGSPASSNGSVGCPTGGLCKDGKFKSSVNTGFPTQIGNGIKFDIKNSLLNCMSKVVTNWAVYNPWDSDTTVCLSQYGLYPPKDKAHDAHTLLYLPI